jgi:ubiquinone/menaquinone biosynthesis C-methylase UbiE
MKTAWDYTELADAYLKRPDYSTEAIDALCSLSGTKVGSRVCDVGAGVAHLTLMLAARGMRVDAVEPNDAMRHNGARRTEGHPDVHWFEGTGEATGRPTGAYDLVTFGSSFNVVDQAAALRESARLLKSHGWFACMWNHRDLDDSIQARIESIIKSRVAEYDYGRRREDQTAVIEASTLFDKVHYLEGRVVHRQSITDCIEAWRSHATLARQAGEHFPEVVRLISDYLDSLNADEIRIPYTTRIWCACKKG